MKAFLNTLAANRRGEPTGIYAICSANSLVLEAAIEQAKEDKSPVLIEATANQVNQFGGYTGMQAEDFRNYVYNLAINLDFPLNRVILGGDHLGPVCWQSEPADSAMAKSRDLIASYVAAGFKKIHLDCSMPCKDDILPLSDDLIAKRAAELCKVAEDTANEKYGCSNIVYIIGTEVPPPGGTNEDIPHIEVTTPDHARNTIETHKQAFNEAGLEEAWERVAGLVVQPGVEFSHASVIHYVPHKAEDLKAFVRQVDNIVFEAHSTDYQLPAAYEHLVQDHFAILKVGPQLTFALREALYALSYIEDHLFDEDARSNLRTVCEMQMVAEPKYWEKFYQVGEKEQPLYRHFSYSDRIRYYWPDKKVQRATDRLLSNLESIHIPLPLISQFLPEQYHAVRDGTLDHDPKSLVKSKIKQVTETYAQACWKQCA